jgi:hypothetical protein
MISKVIHFNNCIPKLLNLFLIGIISVKLSYGIVCYRFEEILWYNYISKKNNLKFTIWSEGTVSGERIRSLLGNQHHTVSIGQ